jgi:hypothetical protein
MVIMCVYLSMIFHSLFLIPQTRYVVCIFWLLKSIIIIGWVEATNEFEMRQRVENYWLTEWHLSVNEYKKPLRWCKSLYIKFYELKKSAMHDEWMRFKCLFNMLSIHFIAKKKLKFFSSHPTFNYIYNPINV